MISKDDVRRIAERARIHFTDTELTASGQDLEEILDFVKKLGAVDVRDILPTTQVTGLENVFREDTLLGRKLEVGSWKLLLPQVPQREDNFVKVKAVFE